MTRSAWTCAASLAILFSVCVAEVADRASAESLFSDDFESGLRSVWRVDSGQWRVIADPTDEDNHVLAASVRQGRGGAISAGDAEWRDYRVSCRIQVVFPTAPTFHAKVACRAGTSGSVFVNLRNNGPAVIQNKGRDFRLVGVLGEEVTPGRWYAVELTCSGDIVSARVRRAGMDDSVEASFLLPDTGRGGISLLVWMPAGDATVLFDDIRVETAPPTPPTDSSGPLVLRDGAVEATFDRSTAAMTLTDTRTGQVWRQPLQGAALARVIGAELTAHGLRADLATTCGRVAMTAEIENGCELLIRLEPNGPGRHQSLRYPYAFAPGAATDELVLPTDQGIRIPVGSNKLRLAGYYHYGQHGVIMPWFGLLSADRGLMTLVETADDIAVEVKSAETGKPAVAPVVVWLPSKGGLRYARTVRYILFAAGDHVDMAKRYRRFLQSHGRFRTLEEKAREVPNVRKLIGAINILDRSRDDSALRWMISHGIRRALYSCGDRAEQVAEAKAAGYVVNRYDIYTDIWGPELVALRGPARNADDYRRIGYPDECFIQRNGEPKPGFAYPIGVKGGVDPQGGKGKRIRCYNRCSAEKLKWLKRIIPPQLKLGFMARFIDVETAQGLNECYSPEHPLTRTEDRLARLSLFDYLRSLGQVCSSEGGADWAAAALHYQEGSMTLNHFGGVSGVYVGTKPFPLPDEYVHRQLDATFRVPLHELVYHDSTFMTWRWNHTPNRWQPVDAWDDWDLLHVLYAAMPIFVVDVETVERCGDRILKSYRDICGFAEKSACSEMVAHRFLTADRMVQETRFANGWGVVVNFSHQQPYSGPEGKLAPKTFRAFRFRP